ncbi:MAG: class I SAM-dependent methyltransferase [Gammaproteobacteria bacterium]|nr:class I SAM-dependent methyltransferase [Gammaproteobacteria bacterium]
MTRNLQTIYDGFAKTYDENRGLFDLSSVLSDFHQSLAKSGGELLDLGCGAGEPVARFFIDHHWQVTGVDFSAEMLNLAQHYVPQMKSLHADIREVLFDAETFDAVSASYSLFHLPYEDHAKLFENIYSWLKPDGKALFTYATDDYTGQKEFSGYKEFMGQSLFYSHQTPEQLFSQLESIGFDVESANKHSIGGETFLWVTVHKK